MADHYDEAREWARGFSQFGADATLEAELHKGRMQKRGFEPDGTPSRITVGRRSVPDDGEPLSQKGKTGGCHRRGATMRKRPAGHDAP